MKYWLEWLAAGIVVVLGVYLMLPTVGPHRNASRLSASKANLKSIGIGLHEYHDAHGSLPPGITYDPDVRPVHGWHVMMLPYLDHRDLHERIDLAEPWTHPDNAEAFETVMREFQSWQIEEEFDEQGCALSSYAANVLLVSGRDPMKFRDITDGMFNTILAGEVNAEFRAWGHPYSFRDPRLGLNKVPHGFGGPWHETPIGVRTQMLLGDGSVRTFDNDIDPAVLNALATPAGGEPPALHEVP